jgi:16S rRNA (uracil1498-N3)-methyltransferase
MRIPRIYTPQILEVNATIQLEPSAAHYVATVLRMKAGRALVLFNGEGGEFKGELKTINRKNVVVELNEFNDCEKESPLSIHLGVSLIKSDPFDWLLQKATELGVNKITPLITEWTDVKITPERIEKKMKHWQQVIIHACQQSGRTKVPSMDSPLSIEHWLEQVEVDCKLVLHPYDSNPLNQSPVPGSVAVLVGPEGGLTDDEVKLAHQYQFKSFSLGPRILRAETAPLVALSLVQHAFGDFD